MPGRTSLRAATDSVPSYWIKFAGLALVATICTAGGLDSLVQHFRAIEPRPYRAASGVLLILCGLLQARVLVHGPSRSRLPGFFNSQDQWWLIRFSLIAASAGYALALLIGPDTNLRYALRAWVAICYTGGLWYLLADKQSHSAESWRRRWKFRRCESAATCVVVLLLSVEIVMRLQATVTNDAIGGIAITRQQAFDPGSVHRGRRVNSLGYWDDEFNPQVDPRRFRIAALGDSVVLGGDRETNCLEQIEAILPDTDVYNFTLPGLSPREYAAQLKCDVLDYKPDLVLLFVSIHDDVTYQLPLPDVFDWRGLRICQWGLQTIAAPASMWHSPGNGGASIDGLPRTESDQILRFAVCRTPIEAHIEERWQRTLSHLSSMVELCLEHELPLALVFVPAAFQLDAGLRRSICLRGGYKDHHVDVQLPQRRLVSFASKNEIPALDLLPELSNSADYVYAVDRPEFSTAGQDLVATTVADWIARSFELEISERRESLLAADDSAPPARSASMPRRGARNESKSATVK